jgi:hypothetical protein
MMIHSSPTINLGIQGESQIERNRRLDRERKARKRKSKFIEHKLSIYVILISAFFDLGERQNETVGGSSPTLDLASMGTVVESDLEKKRRLDREHIARKRRSKYSSIE